MNFSFVFNGHPIFKIDLFQIFLMLFLYQADYKEIFYIVFMAWLMSNIISLIFEFFDYFLN